MENIYCKWEYPFEYQAALECWDSGDTGSMEKSMHNMSTVIWRYWLLWGKIGYLFYQWCPCLSQSFSLQLTQIETHKYEHKIIHEETGKIRQMDFNHIQKETTWHQVKTLLTFWDPSVLKWGHDILSQLHVIYISSNDPYMTTVWRHFKLLGSNNTT